MPTGFTFLKLLIRLATERQRACASLTSTPTYSPRWDFQIAPIPTSRWQLDSVAQQAKVSDLV